MGHILGNGSYLVEDPVNRARRVEAIRVGVQEGRGYLYVGAWLKTEMADGDTAATGRDGLEPQRKESAASKESVATPQSSPNTAADEGTSPRSSPKRKPVGLDSTEKDRSAERQIASLRSKRGC